MNNAETRPMVSIIIPVYNGSNYLREAIDSAIAQTYPNTEIIVINDGSTDNTEEIALSYGTRIRYIKKENGGVSSALNRGIKEMQGELFSWLSHDDAYYPNKVAAQVQAMEDPFDAKSIVLCDTELIDKYSKPIIKKSDKGPRFNESVVTWKKGLHYLLSHGTFNGCSLLIPKAAFEQCGMFDETLHFNQDGLMWLRILLGGYSIIYVPKVCVKSRIHKGQVTQRKQFLFHKDCESMSAYLIPQLCQITTKEDRFLYEYAKYNGKYNNDEVLKSIQRYATNEQFTSCERIIVSGYSMYGKIRPFLRKIFHCLFRS